LVACSKSWETTETGNNSFGFQTSIQIPLYEENTIVANGRFPLIWFILFYWSIIIIQIKVVIVSDIQRWF
jgi:hypothetical protein